MYRDASTFAAGIDALRSRACYLTTDPGADAFLARITRYERPVDDDLHGYRPADLLRGFDSLPRPYQHSLLRIAGRVAGRDKASCTRVDFATGLSYHPSGKAPVDITAYDRHAACRPFATEVARRLSPFLERAATALYLTPDGEPDHGLARRIRAAAETAMADADDEDTARAYRVVARAAGRLDAMTWGDLHVRLAADLATGIAQQDAIAANRTAIEKTERLRAQYRRGSMYLDHLLPVIPGVPRRHDREDEYLPDPDAVQRAEHARSEALALRSAAMHAEDRRRQARTAWHASKGASVADRANLRRMYWRWRDLADEFAFAADEAETEERRTRIETFGEPDVIRACRIVSARTRLRNALSETDAHVAGILALIGGPRRFGLPAQVTDWAFRRAREQVALTRQRLSEQVNIARDQAGAPLVDENGQYVALNMLTLADKKAEGVKARAFAMCKGIEEIGLARGLTLVLLTTTLPPEYHPNPSKGRNSYDPSITPIDARNELQARLHRALALARERGCRFIAPRAREGQLDGTPHDHLAAFVSPEHIEAWISAFEAHFPERAEVQAREAEARGDEARAVTLRARLARVPRHKRVACNSRIWTHDQQQDDPEARATVASYIYGYALKSLSAADDPDDGAARGAVNARQRRMRRWAILGARRGLVGQWDVIYKQKVRPVDETIAAVWDAMQDHRWGEALERLNAFGGDGEPPVTWDYEEFRRGDGAVARRPMALRATGRDVAELTEADVLFVKRFGIVWKACSTTEWQVEQEVMGIRDRVQHGEPAFADEGGLAVSVSFPRSAPAGPPLVAEQPCGPPGFG